MRDGGSGDSTFVAKSPPDKPSVSDCFHLSYIQPVPMAEPDIVTDLPLAPDNDSIADLYRIQYHQYETDIRAAATDIHGPDRPAVLQRLEHSLNGFEESVTNVSEHMYA